MGRSWKWVAGDLIAENLLQASQIEMPKVVKNAKRIKVSERVPDRQDIDLSVEIEERD